MTPDSETRKRLREELETLFANKSNCYTEAEDDDGVLEIAAMTSDVFVEVVLPKLIAAEEEIAKRHVCGEWLEVDSDIGGNRTEVKCSGCKVIGERENETGRVFFPAT